MKMKQFVGMILAIMITLTGSAFALNNTHDNLENAGFEPQPRTAYDNFYTQLGVKDYDYPVVAFETADGTAFRVFGKIGNRTGLYPVNLEIADEGTDDERFVISVQDATPVNNDQRQAAKLALVPTDDIPAGFEYIGKDNVAIRMVNIYGVTETYVHGTYDDPESQEARIGWYRSNGRNPINGMVMVDLSDSEYRVRPEDVKQKRLPQEIQNGFQQNVSVTCSNGFAATIATAFPAIDYVALTAEVKEEQATKTGMFNEHEIVEIPYETQVKANKNMYVNEVDIVLQEGVPGSKQINYRVKYENGQEVSRSKVGETILVRPVKEIVERGTKEYEEVYTFGTNATISATVSKGILTEGENFTAECKIDITGIRPQKGYTASLTVTDIDGNEVGKTTARNSNPGKVFIRDMKVGTYKVTAQATTLDTNDTISYVTYARAISKNDVVATTENETETVNNTPAEEPTPVVSEEPVVTTPAPEQTEEPEVPTPTLVVDDEPSETPTPVPTPAPTNQVDNEGHEDGNETPTPAPEDSTTGETNPSNEDTGSQNSSDNTQSAATDAPKDESGNDDPKDVLGENDKKENEDNPEDIGTATSIATVSETIEIPFETIYQDDNTIFVDQPEVVSRNGVAGKRVVTYQVTYVNDIETERTQLSDVTTLECQLPENLTRYAQ